MSVVAFKAALSSRDPQIRKAVREVPDGTYTAAELRELMQAIDDVRGQDSLHYAWRDCIVTKDVFKPPWHLEPAEFKARLIDPDPSVRRTVWLTMTDDNCMNWESPDFFHAVLTVLASPDYAYAWPDCRFALEGFRSWGHCETLSTLVRVLAYLTDGLGERLAEIIGLPESLFPPRFPAQATGSGKVQCDFCSPDQDIREQPATHCRRVCTLVALLSCSIEDLRLAASHELVLLGPGVAPILRQLRHTSVPGRRAALQTLADLGWNEVDPADRAIIDRLLRIQRINEVAQPVPNPNGTWYAIPTTDQAAVLEAFDLCDPVEVSLQAGFAMWDPAHRYQAKTQRLQLWISHKTPDPFGPYANSYPEVFVTPALDGWTLVLFDNSMFEYQDARRDETNMDEHVRRRCVELSRRFGIAHRYHNPADGDFAGWCIAENGVVVCDVAFDGCPVCTPDKMRIGPGERTIDELRAWLDDHSRNQPAPLHPRVRVRIDPINRLLDAAIAGVPADPPYLVPSDIHIDIDDPDKLPEHREFDVPRIAHRLSVGLETLGPHTPIEGVGVLAVRADPRPPQRYGAPAWSRP